ncbi:hypothetical protein ACVBEE_02320 [Acinetobacter sp. ANC 3781]
MENQDKYTLDVLKYLNDDETFQLLKKRWGYEKNTKLIVMGQIERKDKESSIHRLTNLKNIEEIPLRYPLENYNGYHNIYIGLTLSEDFKNGQWVQANLKLAPNKEREKQLNPFELNVQISSLMKLDEIPIKVIESGIHNNFIENWIVEHLAEKNTEEIKENNKSILADQEILLKRQNKLENQLKGLEEREITFIEKLEKHQEKIESCTLELKTIKQNPK